MPRLKVTDDELDIDELESAEYNEDDFQSYDGEVPPTGTLLLARITKMWWTYSSNDDPMIKVLIVAEHNTGELEEFNGLPTWENLPLTPNVKFKWQPFLDHFGFTLRDIKNKMVVASEDDNQGAPIQKIGSFEPGSDDAVTGLVIKKERYKGEWQSRVGKWVEPDAVEEEPEEEEKPARRRQAAKPKPASRQPAKASRKPARSQPEPEEEEEEEPEEEEEAPPPRSRSRKAAAKPAAKARGARRSRAAADEDEDQDEPPF